MIHLKQETLKKLELYPILNNAVKTHIENKDDPRYLANIVFWFRLIIEKHKLNAIDTLQFDDETAVEFGSWGHNSRWNNVGEPWILDNFEMCVDIAINLAEKFGDFTQEDWNKEFDEE